MKLLITSLIITITTLFVILQLPKILPKRAYKYYSDEQLRAVAIHNGMRSTPKSYSELLKIIDDPTNHLTPQKIALGKELFSDTLLSKDKTISCATCHILKEGGDDNLPTAVGYRSQKNPFHLNTPTVLNSALATSLFWNGRAKDVQEQASGPIQASFEMNMAPKELETRFNENIRYVKEFQLAFQGIKSISFANILDAIGAYERTLLTRGKYDEFLDGNDSAMSQEAKNGFSLFINLGCKGCHTGMSVGGQSMQRFPLRPYKDMINIVFTPTLHIDNEPFPFKNVGGFLGKDNKQLFRVPILRNVTRTAPYFHNGEVKELKEAVRIMAKHQLGVVLMEKESLELLAFLKTLDGEIVDYNISKATSKNLV